MRNSTLVGAIVASLVVVPDALLAKTKELTRYFEISRAYVGSLKPKPTMTMKKKVTS